jgi:two-component system sensor kinase FixL
MVAMSLGDEVRLQSIVETAVDGIITIDQRGVIASFNPAAERIFGYAAGEAIGRNVRMLMPPPYGAEHDGYLARYLQTGEARIIGVGREVTGRRKDGTTFPLRLSVGEFTVGDGRFFTGIVHDLTEQKRAEERALQAERLAAMGQMITVLTHESRNLLQICRANLEMLELEIEDLPEAVQYAARIHTAQDRLTSLFQELREFASPIHLDREPHDLGWLVGQVIDELTVIHPTRRIRLDEVTGGVDLRCSVDAFRMHQVFRNLIENSIAACPDPVTIRAEWSHSPSEDPSSLRVALRDNGPGLPVEHEQRIFEPFFTTKKGGTGLGLVISRRIVEAHGGRIDLGKNGEQGAEFVITLPRESPAWGRRRETSREKSDDNGNGNGDDG